MQNNRVFVYGTLRKGFGNHRLLEDSTFVDNAVIRGEMRHLGGFPGVHLHGNDQVHGEIYEVTEDVMFRLDRLEGHPNFYERQIVDSSKGPVWVYLFPENHMLDNSVIKDGVWRGND